MKVRVIAFSLSSKSRETDLGRSATGVPPFCRAVRPVLRHSWRTLRQFRHAAPDLAEMDVPGSSTLAHRHVALRQELSNDLALGACPFARGSVGRAGARFDEHA